MTATTSIKRVSTPKKLTFVFVALCLFLLVAEVATRVVFYVSQNFNPYFLTFGLTPDTEWNSNDRDGYSKFRSNTTYHQKVSATETINMKINADGFRGLTDFTRPKPPGVFRIVVLGESSTFGYTVKDDETYPAQLEQWLRARVRGRTVEVLNLGIPLARMDNIVAIAKTELPSLMPDLILLYAGYNNAMFSKESNRAGGLVRFKNWMNHHSVMWRSLHAVIRDFYYLVSRRLNRDVMGLPHMSVPIDLTHGQVEAARAKALAEYSADVQRLAEFATQHRVPLILITQTMTLYYLSHEFHDRWRTYGEEMDRVQQAYAETGKAPATSAALLIHGDLMTELRRIAKQRDLVLVEGIEKLDHDRPRMMVSYVHLTKLGNHMLAEHLGDAILRANLLPAGSDAR